MPGALSKFGEPSLGSNTDALLAGKLAGRVEATMERVLNRGGVKQLDPRLLLVAPSNRDGATPNVQHVHQGILQSFAKSGFDRNRPQAGICIAYSTPEGKAKLLEHNKRFTMGNELLPPIDEDILSRGTIYGTIAGTHLNISLRLLKHRCPSPACNTGSLMDQGGSLEEVVNQGHVWWILPETIPHSSQVEVSLWRNQDQNENQASHEVETLRGTSFGEQ